jgi:hypothetical protein
MKDAISKANKGRPAWNKGKKGQIPWNKGKPFMQKENHPLWGKHHSAETKIKIRNTRLDKHNSLKTEFKKGDGIGNKNSNWKGGISKEPYAFEFNTTLKEKIRKRDNYQCQNKECNMTEEEHLIVYGKVLYIHHIDYVKKNCKEENLVSLCNQCNSRVNFNREYWKKYFNNDEVVNLTQKK